MSPITCLPPELRLSILEYLLEDTSITMHWPRLGARRTYAISLTCCMILPYSLTARCAVVRDLRLWMNLDESTNRNDSTISLRRGLAAVISSRTIQRLYVNIRGDFESRWMPVFEEIPRNDKAELERWLCAEFASRGRVVDVHIVRQSW